jgi:hypothetical protein
VLVPQGASPDIGLDVQHPSGEVEIRTGVVIFEKLVTTGATE